ncbi:cytochrome P450 [Actinomadura flavalba]|uniref:cytochrome P450 n=1 Tax=Actinomadura flavalba TaxID=1120938 RepID=UPI00036E5CC9|nr:cytochrome P450 [Actinomadura flavalba]
MKPTPLDHLDATVALLARPYTFVQDRARKAGADVFETRLLGQAATCVTGADAVRLFYDESRFVRHGAMPARVLKTLFGEGGVQTLDGAGHRRRKRGIFMRLVATDDRDALPELLAREWREALPSWSGRSRVELFAEVGLLLTRAVCRWAGLPPLDDRRARIVAAQLMATIDAPAALGPRYLRGRIARTEAERWAGRFVLRARAEGRDDGSPLSVVARHTGDDGALLDRHTAAVELLNLLRPVVASARWTMFAAMALHSDPSWRERLRTGDDPVDLDYFVQEVRRFYPFFPVTAAKAARSFDWEGHHFPAGRLTLLDLHGINHDPRIWGDPDGFRPDRFRGWEPNAYQFVPQGGGDPNDGHRCPADWLTTDLMKVGVRALTRWMTYTVPPQDLRIPPFRAPAQPRSRFVVADVAATKHAQED